MAQVRAFVSGNEAISFALTDRQAAYGWMADTLKLFHYGGCSRADKGVLLRYLERMTGLSRQQVTRLVKRWGVKGKLSRLNGVPRHGFTRRYTALDAILLAEVDALHGTLSGPATKKLMERAFYVFGDARFERLAGISVAHLYNLRGGKLYQDKRRHWTKTRPTSVPIGIRRAPQPNGRPGYIRIDSVCIRATRTASKGCTTSMPWTASPSSSSSPPARKSAKPTCSP